MKCRSWRKLFILYFKRQRPWECMGNIRCNGNHWQSNEGRCKVNVKCLGEELRGSERLLCECRNQIRWYTDTNEAAQLWQAHIRLMAKGGTTALISISPSLIYLSTFVCRDWDADETIMNVHDYLLSLSLSTSLCCGCIGPVLIVSFDKIVALVNKTKDILV